MQVSLVEHSHAYRRTLLSIIDIAHSLNLSPNMGFPLLDCASVASSSMTSQCSTRRPSLMRTMSAAIQFAGWPCPEKPSALAITHKSQGRFATVDCDRRTRDERRPVG